MTESKDHISTERLLKEFSITGKALEMATQNVVSGKENAAKEVLDMAGRYFSDAKHFEKQGDMASAFGALNYAHGWLDAGARLGLFNVKGHGGLFTEEE